MALSATFAGTFTSPSGVYEIAVAGFVAEDDFEHRDYYPTPEQIANYRIIFVVHNKETGETRQMNQAVIERMMIVPLDGRIDHIAIEGKVKTQLGKMETFNTTIRLV